MWGQLLLVSYKTCAAADLSSEMLTFGSVDKSLSRQHCLVYRVSATQLAVWALFFALLALPVRSVGLALPCCVFGGLGDLLFLGLEALFC